MSSVRSRSAKAEGTVGSIYLELLSLGSPRTRSSRCHFPVMLKPEGGKREGRPTLTVRTLEHLYSLNQ